MKKILVSLISEQTIPNVLFIKEMFSKVNKFVFITTEEMEKKNILTNILNVCNIQKNFTKVVVSEFDIKEIKEELNKKFNDPDDYYIVNLTGGTKIMSIGVYEFFKERKSEIFYLPIGTNKYKKIFPSPVIDNLLLTRINVREYMLSYGINIHKFSQNTIADFEMNKKFLKQTFSNYSNEIRYLVEFQNKKELKDVKVIDLNKYEKEINNRNLNINELLKSLKFDFRNLKKQELKYITGGWLEEYIYQLIKNSGRLKDESIILNPIIMRNGIQNELDVAICYNNKLDIIECKTSMQGINGNILNDTIYKQAALRKEFGLTVNVVIVTLDEVNDDFKKRGDYMNIKILDKNITLNEENLKKEIFKIIGV